MKRILNGLIAGLIVVTATAQPKAEQQAVRSLCGCFEVEFMYAETFSPDTGYAFHPRYHARGLEWVVPVEETGKKFVLQHLLIADTFVIKHWREDWEYEKSDWWDFDHDASWKHVSADPRTTKGQWTQTVWEVDDAPRYQGSGQWISSDHQYYWESRTDAPLPRREYTKRKDYNVMERGNRIIITDTGWVHEQDNRKIVRKDGAADTFLAGEKGYNIYRRTGEARCRQAADWWKQHRLFWNTVRESWTESMNGRSAMHLLGKVDGHYLYEDLDALEDQHLSGEPLKTKVKEALAKYSAYQ
jgi:hypothetical protein